jgi:small subunit ribosomal protein S15Ae
MEHGSNFFSRGFFFPCPWSMCAFGWCDRDHYRVCVTFGSLNHLVRLPMRLLGAFFFSFPMLGLRGVVHTRCIVCAMQCYQRFVVCGFRFPYLCIVRLCCCVFGRSQSHSSLGRVEMVRISVLNDCLRSIVNAERKGKRQVMIRPSSKVVIKFLEVMMKHGYIGEFEVVDDRRSNKIVVELLGRINKCGVVTPRFDVPLGDVERWIQTLLPSRQFGFLVLTTSDGIMDHEEARKKHVAGKILG